MIRGPIVSLTRDGLVRLVRQRPELFERGLAPVCESIEFGDPRTALADVLLRDANGTAVLVFAADDRDAALPARVLAAQAFWQRDVGAIARALPESRLTDGDRCRLLLVGGRLDAAVLSTLDRLQLPHLEVLEVEPLYVDGQERLVVRCVRGLQRRVTAVDPAIGEHSRGLIEGFAALAAALDARVRIDGDRYSRQASVSGSRLGTCWLADGQVMGSVDGEPTVALRTQADLHLLGDRLARRLLAVLGQAASGGSTDEAAPAAATTRSGIEVLRATVTAARVSAEECAALGGVDDAGRAEDMAGS